MNMMYYNGEGAGGLEFKHVNQAGFEKVNRKN